MAVRTVYVFIWTLVSVCFIQIVHTMFTPAGDTSTAEPARLINSTAGPLVTTTEHCVIDVALKIKRLSCQIRRDCKFGECYINTTVCDVRCHCLSVHTGPNCQYQAAPDTSNNTRSTEQNENTTTNSADTNGPCVANLFCVHGTCVNGSRCNCTKGWRGFICSERCELDCEHGVCNVKGINRTWYCNCESGYTGEFCEKKIPKTFNTIITETMPADQRYIAGIVVGAVVVLCIIAAVMCWLLWKRRARILLKLIYWIKPYEDDDCKLYDAFISFKSSTSDEMHRSSPEELFVMESLMPKLEGELGFRLCIHFRDFMPGKPIVENVLEAIENSRRTILLLSPSYIEDSFWTRFEYEQAQVAAMERKQRIIPIVFEDISDVDIDDITLRHILKSITYIQWPGHEDKKKLDKFWERLVLTMPKLLSAKTAAEDNEPCSQNQDQVTDISVVAAKTSISNGPYQSFDIDPENTVIEMAEDKTDEENQTNTIIKESQNEILQTERKDPHNVEAAANRLFALL